MLAMWASWVVGGVAVAGLPLPFDSCSATSTLDHSVGDFKAANALTASLDYWCSEAGIGASEEVTWRGSFNSVTQLRGLDIQWALAPQQIKVMGNMDGFKDRVLVEWHATNNKDPSFSESLDFPRGPEALKEIKLVMRGVQHKYIGVRQVKALGTDHQIFILINGVQSPDGEQCLMAASKDFRTGSTPTLDRCEYALANGDGREVWFQLPSGQIVLAQSEPPACLDYERSSSTLEEEEEVSGAEGNNYRLFLAQCDDSNSRFSVEPNSQIRALIDRKNLCLTAVGDQVGFSNLLEHKETGGEASSVADTDHAAANALSNGETYYASKKFPDCSEHSVYWQYDLGSQDYRVDKVKIDWEFPALAYSISGSNDGIQFSEYAFNQVNPSNVTLDDVGGTHSRYIRIVMHRPHPIYGKVGDNIDGFVYGIRQVELLSNRLNLGLEECLKAGQTNTLGDKWFMEAVKDLDAASSRAIRLSGSNQNKELSATQDSASELISLKPEMENCRNLTTTVNDQYMADVEEIIAEMQDTFAALKQRPISLSLSNHPEGFSPEFPFKSTCKPRQNGFFYVDLDCAPDHSTARLLCHDGVGAALYDGARVATRSSTMDIEKACASLGMTALTLLSSKQLGNILSMMRQSAKIPSPSPQNAVMAPSPSASTTDPVNVPLAFDLTCASGVCSGTFNDLGSLRDVTGLLMRYFDVNSRKPNKATAMAIQSPGSPSPVGYSDWLMETQTAFLCGVGTGNVRETGFAAMLDCSTTGLSPIFQGGKNTFVRVSCPSNCAIIDAHPIYGGTGGVYSERSHVCKAAAHAGLLNFANFLVGLESPHGSYDAVVSNGVVSNAYLGIGFQALRLMDAAERCPVAELLDDSKIGQEKLLKKPELVTPKTLEWEPAFEKGNERAQEAMKVGFDRARKVNNETATSYNETEQLQRLMMKMDATSIAMSRQTTLTALISGRALVKPVETTLTRLDARSESAFVQLTRTVRRVLGVVSEFFTKLQDSQSRYQAVQANKQRNIHEFILTTEMRREVHELLPETQYAAGGLSVSVVQRTLFPEVSGSKKRPGAHGEIPEDQAVIRLVGAVSPPFEGDLMEQQGLTFSPHSLVKINAFFYDGAYRADLSFDGSRGTTAAVGYRMRKATTDGYYLFVKQQTEVQILCQFVARVAGRANILTHWLYVDVVDSRHLSIEIHNAFNRHEIWVNSLKVVDIIDESLMSGYFVVGALAAERDAAIEVGLNLKPTCCVRSKASASHLQPQRCIEFRDDKHRTHPSKLFQSNLQIQLVHNFVGRPVVYQALNPPSLTHQSSDPRQYSRDSRADSADSADSAQPIQTVFVQPSNRPSACHRGTFQFDMLMPDSCPDLEIGPILALDDKTFQWLGISLDGVAKEYLARAGDAHGPVIVDEQKATKNSMQPNRWYTVTVLISDDSFTTTVSDKDAGPMVLHKRMQDGGRVGLAFRRCSHLPFTKVILKP